MRKHPTLSVTLPDGTVATRTSTHRYTHAVAFQLKVEVAQAEFDQAVAAESQSLVYFSERLSSAQRGDWSVWSWNGSEGLASKECAMAMRFPSVRAVQVVEVTA